MKLQQLLSGLALSALVASPLALAEVPITVTAGGSLGVYDDDRDLDEDVIPFGALEYRFDQNWASELWYSGGDVDADLDGADEGEIDLWHLDGLYYTTPKGKWHPYMAFGLGTIEREWDTGGSNSDFQVNAGGGVRYFFTDHWNLRADARLLQAVNNSVTDFAISVGLSYAFGSPVAPAPDPAPAPAPEPVPAAPLDSDGDGVTDDMDECPNTSAGARVDDRGCEIVVPQVASIKLTVYFGFDSDEVDTRFFEDIEGLANFLNRFPELKVNVEGHTDSRGKDSYNMGLSQRRAEAVRDILVNQYGIDGSRLVATGYGETQPVDTNDTDEGRANNRRVMATLEVEFDG